LQKDSLQYDTTYKDIRYVVFRSGRGCAKSYNISQFLVFDSLEHPNSIYPVYREIKGSSDYSTMNEIWGKICYYGLEDSFTRKGNGTIINNATTTGQGGFIFQGISTSTGTAKGVKSFYSRDVRFAWVEEGQDISEIAFNKMKNSIRGDDSIIIISMNPTKQSDICYRLATCGDPHVLDIPLKVEDNPFFAEKSKIDMEIDRKTMTETEFKWIWEGEFLDAESNSLFTSAEINAMRTYKSINKQVNYISVMGVDYSSIGDDKTCITIRQGDKIKFIGLFKFAGDVASQTMEKIIQLKNQFKVDRICYDADGVGAELRSAFVRYNEVGIPINGSGTPNNENYFNKRTEVYFNLKKQLEIGLDTTEIDEKIKEMLLEEMGRIIYDIDSSKMKLISKSIIRRLLGRSPDIVDSLAYTFALPDVDNFKGQNFSIKFKEPVSLF